MEHINPIWMTFFSLATQIYAKTPPHIIIIVIDDLGNESSFPNPLCSVWYVSGYNDVPWNNENSLLKYMDSHSRSVYFFLSNIYHSWVNSQVQGSCSITLSSFLIIQLILGQE